MNQKQEIAMAHAIAGLEQTGAVFVIAYGFPGDTDCYVEGMGDMCSDHQALLLNALRDHWRQDSGMDEVAL